MSTFSIDMTLSVFRNIRLFDDYDDNSLMDEVYYEQVLARSPYENVSSIEIDRVALTPMNEWLENRSDSVYQETLLGIPHMLSFLLQQDDLPKSWQTRRDIAKPTSDDPEPEPILIKPVIHFPGHLLQKRKTKEDFIPHIGLGTRWYFNYRVIPTRFGEQDLVARYI